MNFDYSKMGKLHIWSLTFRSCVKLVPDLLIVFFGPLPFIAMSIWLLLLSFGWKLLTCQMDLVKNDFYATSTTKWTSKNK